MKSEGKGIREKIFNCVNCNNSYQLEEFGKKKEDSVWRVKIEICSNCNSFYNKTSNFEFRNDSIDRFKKREEKARNIKGKIDK